MWMAAVVGAVAVYWFVWVMGSTEVKGKRAVNLKMRSIMQDKDKAAAEDGEKETFSSFPKQPRHCEVEMPLTDSEEDSFLFPMEEIVQYPLTGYVAPSSISFSPDGCLISYLFSPDGTLHCKVFTFDVASRRQELMFCLPDGGGLNENNLSAEEKLRRERSREWGLGVTRYISRKYQAQSQSSSLHVVTIGAFFKRDAPPGEKPEPVRTHLRNMIIVPEMIGSIIGVHNGKTFNQVEIKPEMIGHYLAKFSISYKPVKHGRPGIGATHSSRLAGMSQLLERGSQESLWEIEPLTTFPMYPSSFPLRLKRPWPSDLPSLHGGRDDLMWLRDGDRAISL
ncbi:hypothetical protein ZIOFF_028450 [Zingiber officinale]|uniref:40S ribosomal protein S15 n=1 Tax=Zingiber officinale TaxID=94328 RepID=A0A8J5GVX8_ZINOF|nr:hypothetical protein ZIOFF_028450 [Zingiber officinale]